MMVKVRCLNCGFIWEISNWAADFPKASGTRCTNCKSNNFKECNSNEIKVRRRKNQRI